MPTLIESKEKKKWVYILAQLSHTLNSFWRNNPTLFTIQIRILGKLMPIEAFMAQKKKGKNKETTTWQDTLLQTCELMVL